MDQNLLAKKALRKQLLADRMALPQEKVAQFSRQIFERWRNRFSLKRIGFFHVYQHLESRNEVRTKDFENFVRERHPQVRIVIPVVDHVSKTLRHAILYDDIELVPNRWGILEPHMAVEFLFPMQMDMVIVPMLGFDMMGHRLGYGAGYYDRFLSLTRPSCIKIGVCFSQGMQSEPLPSQPHDVPLDFIVTETNIYRFNPNFQI